MAIKTDIEIIQEIKTHIEKNGGEYHLWYMGITTEARNQLFEIHKVDRENGKWIYRNAGDNKTATAIKEYFVKLSVREISDITPLNGKIVYAYKKSSITIP